MAFKLSDSFVFEAVSEKGDTFIKKNKKLFREASAKELQAIKKQEADAIKKMSAVEVNMACDKTKQ